MTHSNLKSPSLYFQGFASTVEKKKMVVCLVQNEQDLDINPLYLYILHCRVNYDDDDDDNEDDDGDDDDDCNDGDIRIHT